MLNIKFADKVIPAHKLTVGSVVYVKINEDEYLPAHIKSFCGNTAGEMQIRINFLDQERVFFPHLLYYGER